MSLRRRAIAYLVALHAIFAALAVYLFLDNAFWLIAVEVVFALSLVIGLRLSREMYRHLGLTAEGLRLIRDEEFTSRFLPVGQPEIDELIGIYNRMVDHLREERVRVAEQHQFLSRVLQVSPSGIVILDFDGRISSLNPAAERLLDADARPPWSGAVSKHSPRRWERRSRISRPGMRSSSACSGRGESSATTARSSIAASREASC